MSAHVVATSKFLSLILRHKPETIGLTLDAEGWAPIDDLIARAKAHGRALTRALIEDVVATNDKKRFAISADGRRIRASQGHSLVVDLALEPQIPPEFLFHGTATRFLDSIFRQGLLKGSRQHVHLSPDHETAVKVGQRHGRPVVLRIAAARLNATGKQFFLSANGVWLVDQVPPEFFEVSTKDRHEDSP